MLPKFPTVVDSSDQCRELEKRTYYAYADETIYELIVAAKSGSKPPKWCEEKVRFDEKLIYARLMELRSENTRNVESSVRRFDRQVALFSNGMSARWVVPDPVNDRWIELAVHAREGKDLDQGRFLDSIDFKGLDGKDIGAGAETTLGDALSNPAPAAKPSGEPPAEPKTTAVTEPFRIIGKPRARYTNAARDANTSGSVRVKVTLLSNGGIGAVTPVKELPHGLTEQAVAAARRIVFLPKRVNGVPVSVVQTFEYSFSIY